MKKNLHIATSPFTGTIYCGTLLKSGLWSSDKQDLTIEALCAVVDHVNKFGKPVIISEADGQPLYKITVENLNNGVKGANHE